MSIEPKKTKCDGLMCQLLMVTSGPHEGRFCYNDDDGWQPKSEFDELEVESYEEAGLVWRTLFDEDGDEPTWSEVGVDVEYCYFGYPMRTSSMANIPSEFLKVPNVEEILTRMRILQNWRFEESRGIIEMEKSELRSVFGEFELVSSELTDAYNALNRPTNSSMLFLSHSSADKPDVLKVATDLKLAGYGIWLDQAEINIGESIVDSIDEALSNAKYLLLFISEASMKSLWVKREWQSSLARSLSNDRVSILPVMLSGDSLPNLISDLKYADFRHDYAEGMKNLLQTLSRIIPGENKTKIFPKHYDDLH